ncbi:MAG: FAD:protein FMN transferase [Candidatus Cloacimonetes bacterium]|nr:FAD:protein FMN transferase [Candidatus Cloacimonadota bacterium]HOH78336.1 FAD:protein FMN transferase [Candidatus Cloacimonadota bacterium]HPN40123.1 FAD:protein FMN transferase [Candidatus Cloacimonadota bacterium]
MSRKEIISIVILVLVAGYGAWQYFHSSFTQTKSQHLMDTVVRVTATSKSKNIGTRIDSVFSYIKRLEDKLNDYSEDSWLWKINHSDQTQFAMDPDIYELLVISDSLYKITDGGFDPTIKPVYDLWGFGSRPYSDTDSLANAVPDSLVLAKTLEQVGFDKIRFDARTLYKPVEVKLAFGAIAKGYILDKARAYMKSMGIISGNIDCRSSMTFYGSSLPQQVYIQHPMLSQDDYIASFKIYNKSVGTSGNYQQFFELNGIRYHHILNPKTGYPVPNVYSCTVIHPSAAWADGLSTALFLVPPDRAIELARSIPDCDAVIYFDQDGSTVSLKTMGMKDIGFSEKI